MLTMAVTFLMKAAMPAPPLAVSSDLLSNLDQVDPLTQAFLLALATLISEDLTAISGGIMAGAAPERFVPILLGCWLGMWLGDMVYYFLGRGIGKPVTTAPFLRRIISEKKLEMATEWFDRRGYLVLVITRAIPGTRPATYLTAGILRFAVLKFMAATSLLSLIWTLVLVHLSKHIGIQLMEWARVLKLGLISPIICVVLILLIFMALTTVPNKIVGKRRAASSAEADRQGEPPPTGQ